MMNENEASRCVCGGELPMHLQEFMKRGGYTHIAECHCGVKWVAKEKGFVEAPEKRRSRTQFTWRSVKREWQDDEGPNPINGPLSRQSSKHSNGSKKQRKSKRRKPQ